MLSPLANFKKGSPTLKTAIAETKKISTEAFIEKPRQALAVQFLEACLTERIWIFQWRTHWSSSCHAMKYRIVMPYRGKGKKTHRNL